MSNKATKSDVDPFNSFLAGSIAGAVEASITYPFEFAKTRLQLIDKASKASRNPLVLIYKTVKTQGYWFHLRRMSCIHCW